MHLSPTLNRLSDVIGVAAALALAERFGGGEIYVPLRIQADHPVAQCIGVEAAEKLAAAFGSGQSGARIDIPKGDDITRARRNRAIVAASETGVSKQALGRAHGLTTRWVRRICNGAVNDDRQLGLFDPPSE